jgi:hypothetical protein
MYLSRSVLAGLSALMVLVEYQDATANDRLGGLPETDAVRATVPQVALGTIAPVIVFPNASFATAGAGLRNRLLASIEIPGEPTDPPRAAYLYWAVITNGPVPAAARSPRIARRTAPAVRPTPLAAAQIGFGASPCWGGTGIAVFRAAVPLNVARGGGVYEISFPAGASGLPNNRNPWNGSDFPMLEGASLVFIYGGDNIVALYDIGLSGQTFGGGIITYTLLLPQVYTSFMRYDNIGADGQIGFGRQPTADTTLEETFVNSVKIAGPGSVYNDSLWNGGIAGPLPQLWDNTSIDLTDVVLPGTSSLVIQHSAASDCLTPVANVVAVR